MLDAVEALNIPPLPAAPAEQPGPEAFQALAEHYGAAESTLRDVCVRQAASRSKRLIASHASYTRTGPVQS
jgi:hypothetical protein